MCWWRAVTGSGASSLAAERYDPSTGTWAVTGSLTMARQFATATLLPNRMVLVAGGPAGFSSTATTELYDPVTRA
jgi:hypothetical protein